MSDALELTQSINAWEGRWPLNTYSDLDPTKLSQGARDRLVTAESMTQKQFGELMEKYLVGMNLPSRAQLVGMAERLQSIESQLNEIKALLSQMNRDAGNVESAAASKPRPPRTKRPPAERAQK